ncbi:NAD(P)-dependent oxidoreductase [Nocardioides sp. MAHUQ-72]|uniref:NAD(P)-dependent oxidoreductase n=1 Tax=unclassified Nocardioides TaxID=2615069 RepID=UPI00361E6AF0
MRVLFADSVGGTTVDELEARGHTCVVEPGLQAAELADRVGGFDVLVVRSTKVPGEVFETADRLALVIRAGAGTNTIDTEAAAARGVLVANLPGRNAAAVAELTMGLLLAIDRRIVDAAADLRAGRWDKKTYSAARGLLGSTMGIIGLGSIGLEVAQRATAFGIDLRALARPGRSAEVETRAADLRIGLADSLEELLPTCDVVTLHLPSNADTAGLVDEAFLSRMKRGAILLNTSRGDLVDEGALLRALDEHDLRAGLDVYADEPGAGRAEWSSPLARHPRVVGTHHIGASTQQAQDAVAAGVVELVDAFVQGEARNCVNLTPSRIGSATLTVRHLDRVGVLAHVLDRLSRARLNVEHMENRVFRGGGAAVATIDVAGPVSEDLLADLDALPEVLGVSATSIDAAD